MYEREDDPMAPVFPAEPMPPQPARVRPRLPKLRGATLEAIALWTMACAEQADWEALQWDAERAQFKGGAASAYRTVARRLVCLLATASLGGVRPRAPGAAAGAQSALAEHIVIAVRKGNHRSVRSVAQALRGIGYRVRRSDLFAEARAMLADGRLIKTPDGLRVGSIPAWCLGSRS
jgi:hypothetical protein